MISGPKQKLYCYVDETGQDDRSVVFIVAVVVTQGEQERIREVLVRLENEAHTNHLKWHKTESSRRLAYLRLVMANGGAIGGTFFGSFVKPVPFFQPTLEVIEDAVKAAARPPYRARVFVDGIDRKKAAELTTALRARGVALDLVRGKRDESEPLIRLADMWAGCIRGALAGRTEERLVFDRAMERKHLRGINGDAKGKTP